MAFSLGFARLRPGRGCSGADSPDYKETTNTAYLTVACCGRVFGPILKIGLSATNYLDA